MTTRIRRRRPGGFTLIEVMVVVAIIGILASIAIPTFQTFTMRAKAAERGFMLTYLRRSVDDVYVRYGAFPKAPLANGQANPPGVPGTTKKAWTLGYTDWPLIVADDSAPQGTLYYQYSAIVMALPGIGGDWNWLQATGDLDGDGVTSLSWRSYIRTGEVMVTISTFDDDVNF